MERKRITKTSLVREICGMLANNGIKGGYCYNLNLPIGEGEEIVWVSTTQILMRRQIEGSLWKLHRQPLYSKDTSLSVLLNIREKMYNELNNK